MKLARREMQWLSDQTHRVMAERRLSADDWDVRDLDAALMRGDGAKIQWISSKYGVVLDA